jgi:hypothetical protein
VGSNERWNRLFLKLQVKNSRTQLGFVRWKPGRSAQYAVDQPDFMALLEKWVSGADPGWEPHKPNGALLGPDYNTVPYRSRSSPGAYYTAPNARKI